MNSLNRYKLTGLVVLILVTLPYWSGNPYYLHIATLIASYWILVSGLNLVVGFTGVLSVGHVGLLAVGAYTYTILTSSYDVNPWASIVISGSLGGICGLLLALPSLRLPGFYFAMATIAFTMMVEEFTLAQDDLTGGGIGMSVPELPAPFDTAVWFYFVVLFVAIIATWISWNLSRLMWGRAMIALRDSAVAASAVGIPMFKIKVQVFTFSGVSAGIAGALFAILQSYITPETFVFELSLFFFVAIIVGGRGGIWGPLIGTVVLALLPELSGSMAHWSGFAYGILLLVVVLLVPEGIGSVVTIIKEKMHRSNKKKHVVSPEFDRLRAALLPVYK